MNVGTALHVQTARRASADDARVSSASAWTSASLVAMLVCCAADVLVPRPTLQPGFLLSLLALAVPLAMLHGALWSAAFALLKRAPQRVASGVWFVAAMGSMAWLAQRLGAFARLHSQYARLAVLVIAACATAALVLAWLCAAMQPSGAQPAGQLRRSARGWRYAVAAVLLVAAIAMQLADRRFFPHQYAVAHAALRFGTLWAVMFALMVAGPRLARIHWFGWTAALLGFAACAVWLDARRTATLDAFEAHAWSNQLLTISRTLVDVDRDGHASLLGGSDCAPFNAQVHPGAREIPDNGLDDNCTLGDATTKHARQFERVPWSDTSPPFDIVLITVDALNPQHLGMYNPDYGPKGRNTSPNLDRWAEHASVFEHAYTPGGWTSIAIPALLRGVYARKLEWMRYYETNLYALVKVGEEPRLKNGEHLLHLFPLAFDDPHPSLPEMLKRRGYTTAAVTDDGYSAMLSSGTGIERGFDNYRELDELPPEQRDDSKLADLAIELLGHAPSDRKQFLWAHFFGTHWPVTHHPGVRDYGSSTEDQYDHEVAYADLQIARLLDAIAQRQRATAVIITADHGEAFNPATPYHGFLLDEPTVRIPLIAKVPGWPAGRIKQLASAIDLVPTILALVGSPLPDYLDGIDLGANLDRPRMRALVSDTWRYEPPDRMVGDFAAVYDGVHKYTLERDSGTLYLADQSEIGAYHGKRVTQRPNDPLMSFLLTYLEETGGIRFDN